MAAAAMAHAYPLVRGCGGEASPGPAARSQAWKLRAARRGLAARSGPETGAGDVASPPRGVPRGYLGPPAVPRRGEPGGDVTSLYFGGGERVKEAFCGQRASRQGLV